MPTQCRTLGSCRAHPYRDWVLVFKILCVNKKQAMLIEKHIKSMKSRKYIENLIKYPEISQKLLEKYFDASDC